MQEPRSPRSNHERTQATREGLVAAARELFVRRGYSETSTPEIVAAVGMTRGALYHHFKDKSDLFRVVLEQEAAAVAAEIEVATPAGLAPRDALMAGTAAYLDAMTVPGRTRLLLIEGPAVLGGAAIQALDDANAGRTLREGLAAAMAAPGKSGGNASASGGRGRSLGNGRRSSANGRSGRTSRSSRTRLSVTALASLLSAAFDRAALAIDAGADATEFRAALIGIIERILSDDPRQGRP